MLVVRAVLVVEMTVAVVLIAVMASVTLNHSVYIVATDTVLRGGGVCGVDGGVWCRRWCLE